MRSTWPRIARRQPGMRSPGSAATKIASATACRAAQLRWGPRSLTRNSHEHRRHRARAILTPPLWRRSPDSWATGVFSTSRFRDNLRLFVPQERLIELLEALKSQCGFNLLSELGATDYLGYPGRTRPRFEVHYVLRNLDSFECLVVKARRRRPRPGAPLGRPALARGRLDGARSF